MKLKHIIFTVICTLIFTSCDLERLPDNAYTKEQIEADKEAAFQILLNGCYGHLKGWADVMHRVGEYPSDNIMIRGTSTDAFYPFISYQHIKDNYRLTTFWNTSYKVISQASDLINMSDEETSTTERKQKIGEMYYLRGMCYFYLCRVFGRPYYQSPETNLGVPILLDGTPDDVSNLQLPDRATVKDTYAQAISDLKKAESLMTVEKRAAYATKEAAQAMLSRIYLYMSGTYENPNTEYANLSIEYAEKVIQSGRYALLDRINFMKYNIFPPDGSSQTETIFAIKRLSSEFSGDDYYNTIGGMYATIQGQGWGEMYASAKYLDLLRKAGLGKDARWAFIDPQYIEDEAGQKTPAFRFIADLKNASGVQTGYTYVQEALRYNEDNSLYIKVGDQVYPLTVVNAEENQYSIVYNGKTYIGEKDYLMLLNRVFPMFYVTKCSLQDNESHLHSPIVSRLAELYLNAAEASAKKGNYGQALIYLNKIRGRAIIGGEYKSLNAINAAQLIDEERQLELGFEAHRTYDVYRNGQDMVRNYPGPHDAMTAIPATDLRVVHFIPQAEINAYPSELTQNP